MDTNSKGQLALCKVICAAAEKGFAVSKPLSDHVRYDLILDDGLLKRVEVKYASGKLSGASGVARVELEKRYKNSALMYSDEDIDLLLVYLPAIDRICAFGPEQFVGKKNLHIRYEPAKNGQKRRCLLAADYFW